MLTSTATTSKQKRTDHNIWQQDGFSIVEILVALALVAIIFVAIPFSLTDSNRSKIDSTLSKLNRAVRFSTDESVLRNAIVRIKIELDKEPMEFSVEYGTSANFVLPEAKDFSRMSLKDREMELERLKKIDSQFAKVDEFKDSSEPVPEGISIYGVGTTYNPHLVTEGNAYIYFYPTGEKDSALIILTSPEEIVTLKIFPFEERTVDKYIPLTENDLANLEFSLENKTKEAFEEWLRE